MKARAFGVLSFGLVSLIASAAAAQDELGELPCRHDDALARAAAVLLLDGGALTPGRIARVARAAGSDAPALRSLRTRSAARTKRWIDELEARADAPVACGVARGESGGVVLAAERAGGLDPIDVGQRRLRGSLAGGFERPEIVVRTRARLLRFGVTPEELARGLELPPEVEPPAMVQLVARGPSGPRPVAERLFGGRPVLVERPSIPVGPTTLAERVYGDSDEPGFVVTARDATAPAPGDGDLPGRVERMRREAGTSVLRQNRLLAEVARAHAGDVCRRGRVAHALERGDPEERLARRGIRARVVGEVVARASSPAAAMDALTQSPSHQLTLLDRRFTDAGIGRAVDRGGRTCLVVLLAAWPRYVGR